MGVFNEEKQKVAINTTFHVINCIMIFIIAALLKNKFYQTP